MMGDVADEDELRQGTRQAPHGNPAIGDNTPPDA